ncbi:MAG: transposase [Synergistaceae bacterium]|nr:transposase [Synergistaceae bacterium]
MDRFYPSSKTCSSCSYVLPELPLSIREWECPKCGIEHDCDVNAAINIERVGASTLKGDGGYTGFGQQPLLILYSPC